MLTPIITAITAATAGVVIGAAAVGITAGRRIHHLEDQLDAARVQITKGGVR
ncbi:hypothetical protein [Microbispora rosea]|uniref:hypothetical protein n=1 Tax=Microbispora rosea TaxID=58117 RepID=UPI0037B82082